MVRAVLKIVFRVFLAATAAVVLLLCIVALHHHLYYGKDKEAINILFETLRQVAATKDVEGARRLLSSSYQNYYPSERFADEIQAMVVISAPTIDIEPNRVRATISPGVWCGGAVLQLSKENGDWKIDGIVDWWVD